MVKSCPNWHITAVKFQRIRCTTCFTSPDTKETTPAGKGHACCFVIHGACCYVAVKLLQNKKFLKFGPASLERIDHWEPWDQRTSRTSQTAQNGKASCCTLLKQITKLKCVNSEFRSVDIHPKQGCLNWPYGTLSESP